NEPTPTEIHFFVGSKDAGKRDKLIDLMIQERQAKRRTDKDIGLSAGLARLTAQGYRAMGIRVNMQDSASGLDSLPMSRVDLLWTVERVNERKTTRVLLE